MPLPAQANQTVAACQTPSVSVWKHDEVVSMMFVWVWQNDSAPLGQESSMSSHQAEKT